VVDDLVGQIAVASREQSQGISQVNLAVTAMDKVTQSNAATAEESASASQELNSQATIQKAAVDELLALVGGNVRPAKKPDPKPVETSGKVLRIETPGVKEAPFAIQREARDSGVKPDYRSRGTPPLTEEEKEAALPMGDFKDF
jgi:hypothetical protein